MADNATRKSLWLPQASMEPSPRGEPNRRVNVHIEEIGLWESTMDQHGTGGLLARSTASGLHHGAISDKLSYFVLLAPALSAVVG